MTFDKDIYSQTFLTLHKDVVKSLGLKKQAISTAVFSWFSLTVVQMIMVVTFVFEISDDEEMIKLEYNKNFETYVARFCSTIALHMMLVPDIGKGVKLMSFVNSNYSQFDSPKLAWFIGLSQATIAISAEFLNLYKLE